MVAITLTRQNTKQLLVIDQNIESWRDLVNNAGVDVSVLILDPMLNGLTQIANAITAYSNLDAIHIVSHGSPASLQLGSTSLSNENLDLYTEQLTIIGNALSANGDILLYGCNVAQGETGQQFIKQLSVLTGADVAASTNVTGDSKQDGDWVLESQTGAIEATSIISNEAQTAYYSTFGTPLGVFIANGTELWMTDGTTAGTDLLKPINVGTFSNPQNLTSLGNGKALFAVTNQSASFRSDEVWVTDGTTAGTGSLVTNLHAVLGLRFIAIGNGKALFSAFNPGTLSTDLWVTDGTTEGTNTLAVPDGFFSTGIVSLGNGKALLAASDVINHSGLWISDGTTAGTSLVKTISNGAPSSTGVAPSANIGGITSLGNGSALFTATDTVNGNELWVSDGTTAGTVLVKDIVTGTNGSNSSSFTLLGNGKAVFTTYDATNGYDLWMTDGTTAGTHLVKSGLGNFGNVYLSSFTSLGNGEVLFATNLGLWVTDGTTTGTNLLSNIIVGKPIPNSSVVAETSQMITAFGNGQALFSAYDSTNGYELWITDGTTAGTHLVKDINAGINNSNPQFFTALGNGKVTFSATDENNGTELWLTDGTVDGTSLLKNVNSKGDNSNPQSFATLDNGKVLFSAFDGINGTELWSTDGTAAGTSLVKDISAGITSTVPGFLTSLGNGKVLFKTGFNDLIIGNENLWVSDGTTIGTNLLKAATGFSNHSSIISLNNGKAIFAFYDTNNGDELWVTDGTVSGTSLVKDIVPGIGDSNPNSFFSLGNDKVIFSIYNGFNNQLWVTDGTATGTSLLKDIVIVGNGIFYPDAITSLGNGKALFSIYKSELWITDGTMAGTTQVTAGTATDIYYAKHIASLSNGKAVFTNYDAINGNELWITDGTFAGTSLLKDINPGVSESFVEFITSLGNGKVLFKAYDASNFSKIWVTDGTAAGTTVFAGTAGSSYFQLGNGKLLFSGNDTTNGTELWITDGTAAGTGLVKDICTGIGSSNPQDFALLANGTVVFSAFDAVHGRELWITDGTATGTNLVNDINTLATQSSNPSSVTLITGSTNTNIAPTLTSFSSAVASGAEDSEITINFASLQTQSNASDVDGNVTAFVIKAVNSGSLKIGTDALTATVWSASNNTVDATHQAYWTPALNANGTLNAFTVVAKDNGGLESTTPIRATIDVMPVADVSVTAGVSTVVEGGTPGTFLISLDSPAPTGGLTVNYSINGSEKYTGFPAPDYTVSAGTNITAITTNTFELTSNSGSAGIFGDFTIAAGQTSAVLILHALIDDTAPIIQSPIPSPFINIPLTDSAPDTHETVTLSLLAPDINISTDYKGTGYQLAQNDGIIFKPKVDYPLDSGAVSVGVGDFNNDGKLDIAVTNIASKTVSVLMGNANGFDAKIDYAAGSWPYAIGVGDFNNDGKTDLAIANNDTNTVSVLLRNAANTGFDPKVDYETGTGAESITVGDFNNDGKVDLVITDGNTVSVLYRNADNTGFDPKVDYTTSGFSYSSVASGDFDGDGKLDIVVVRGSTTSVLYRNTANTGFDSPVAYAGASGFSGSIAIGDFNGDGKLDIAATSSDQNTVSVLFRNADNTDFDPKIDYATGSNPWSVSAGDFNGDGKTDLATTNRFGDTISVLLRNAANTDFDPKVDYVTGAFPYALATGDFNNDGKTDLVTTDYKSNSVSILLNNTVNTSATLTILEQPNTAPVLVTPTTVIYTDNIYIDTFATATGTLNGGDIDAGTTLTYGIIDGTDNLDGSVSKSNAYGILTVNKTSGAYSFVPDSTRIEPLGVNATDSDSTLLVTVSDGSLTDNKPFIVTVKQQGITETNDNDTIIGTSDNDTINALAGDDTIDGSTGNDILTGGTGKDIYNLAESTPATDIINIAAGDSPVSSFDLVNNFTLGTGVNTTGVDQLKLANTQIAIDTTGVDGVNTGVIQSHSINNGIIRFDEVNSFATPVAINANNLSSAISYLQNNISNGDTVAFVSGNNTYVFQDGGVKDTLVELVGVTVNSVNTTGQGVGAIWLV